MKYWIQNNILNIIFIVAICIGVLSGCFIPWHILLLLSFAIVGYAIYLVRSVKGFDKAYAFATGLAGIVGLIIPAWIAFAIRIIL